MQVYLLIVLYSYVLVKMFNIFTSHTEECGVLKFIPDRYVHTTHSYVLYVCTIAFMKMS